MRVLLSGYYGFGNLGDEALLAGIAGALRGRGFEVEVLSADPADTARRHGVRAAHRLRGLPAALLRADAVVSGGGGLLQDRSSARSLTYYLGVLRAARALRVPSAVFAQSVGPLSPRGRDRVARALAGVPVAVRDEPSRELLASLGVPSELVGDGALLLPRGAPSEPPAGAPTLLLPRAGHPRLTDALIGAGRALRAEGRRVGALAVQPGEDAAEMARLGAGVDGLELLSAGGFEEALERIAASRFVMSARLHGLILAAVARRPFLGLEYDPKVRGFAERAGAACLPPDVTPERAARAALDEPRPDPERLEALFAGAGAGIAWLDRTLRGG